MLESIRPYERNSFKSQGRSRGEARALEQEPIHQQLSQTGRVVADDAMLFQQIIEDELHFHPGELFGIQFYGHRTLLRGSGEPLPAKRLFCWPPRNR